MDERRSLQLHQRLSTTLKEKNMDDQVVMQVRLPVGLKTLADLCKIMVKEHGKGTTMAGDDQYVIFMKPPAPQTRFKGERIMSEQDIYEIQITRCRMPSSTRYENLLSATSPTLEGIIDMVNEFYQEHKSAQSDKQE